MNTPTRYGAHGKYVEVWGVQSDSRPEKIYTVARTAENVWSCSCPRWTLNARRPECKHIRHVKAGRSNYAASPMTPMPETVKKALSLFSAIEL